MWPAALAAYSLEFCGLHDLIMAPAGVVQNVQASPSTSKAKLPPTCAGGKHSSMYSSKSSNSSMTPIVVAVSVKRDVLRKC